ncbi:uncharacterized protein [Amphiura filiformis]|uniref:uncharacterized protein n=1 Tax=Amphiura filiformis TaxID=82378 RepID=UPI003B20BA36
MHITREIRTSVITLFTAALLCCFRSGMCRPLSRRSVNEGGQRNITMNMLVHTYNLITKQRSLLTTYSTDLMRNSNGQYARQIQRCQVPGVHTPNFHFNHLSFWIHMPVQDKMVSHLEVLQGFRSLISATNLDNEVLHITGFDNQAQHVVAGIDHVIDYINQLIALENLNGISRIHPHEECNHTDGSLSRLDEILYILQQFNTYATGPLSAIYLNNGFEIELEIDTDHHILVN